MSPLKARGSPTLAATRRCSGTAPARSTSTALWAASAWRSNSVVRTPSRRPPLNCPVCNQRLALTRLTCPACDTELSGGFSTCEVCVLTNDDREVLRVFLSSRGNMKELGRHLGVSYPTARARFDALLGKIGIDRPAAAPTPTRGELMQTYARGDIDIEEALKRLESN